MSPKRFSICSRISGRLWLELGGHRAGLDQGDPHLPAGQLLAERLAERAHRVLGGVVDPAARGGPPARHRADVHQVGHPAGPSSAAFSRWGSAAPATYSRPLHVHLRPSAPTRRPGRPRPGPSSITPALFTTDVQAAQLGGGPLHGRLAAPRPSRRPRWAGPGRRPLTSLGQRVQAVGSAGHDGHGGALGGQGQRARPRRCRWRRPSRGPRCRRGGRSKEWRLRRDGHGAMLAAAAPRARGIRGGLAPGRARGSGRPGG